MNILATIVTFLTGMFSRKEQTTTSQNADLYVVIWHEARAAKTIRRTATTTSGVRAYAAFNAACSDGLPCQIILNGKVAKSNYRY